MDECKDIWCQVQEKKAHIRFIQNTTSDVGLERPLVLIFSIALVKAQTRANFLV